MSFLEFNSFLQRVHRDFLRVFSPRKSVIPSKWKLWEKTRAFILLFSSNYESTALSVTMTSERFSSSCGCAVSQSPLQADSQWRANVFFFFRNTAKWSHKVPSLISAIDLCILSWDRGGGAIVCVCVCGESVLNVIERVLCHMGDCFFKSHWNDWGIPEQWQV